MARKLSRREGILLVAMGIGLAVWVGRPRSDAPPLNDESPEASAEKAKPREAPVVQLALLETKPVSYDAGGRDLFAYSQRPPSAAELARRAAEAARIRREQEAADKLRREYEEKLARERAATVLAHANDPPPPPPRPQPPAIAFKFMGYMGPKDERLAFFESGKELVMAREGEVLLKEYRVVEIGYDTVTIGFTRPEFKNDRREIPMSRR